MICYLYPPILSSGVTRSLEFSRHLADFGWQPEVLTVLESRDEWNPHRGGEPPAGVDVARTREWPLHQIVETAHGALSRVARAIGTDLAHNYVRDTLCFPDTQVAWWSTWPAIRMARRADAIYVSCSPFSSALSGVLAKLSTRKPLLLDFRDAWSLNPHDTHTRLHRRAAARLERFVLSRCDRLVLNTPGSERLYRSAFPGLADRMRTIPNGYDELMVAAAPDLSKPFRILHVGHFYGRRQPDLLLEALSDLQDLDIEFVQLGERFPAYERFKDRVRITLLEPLPRAAALQLMQTASLLYIKQGQEPGVADYTPVAAKTYEYLASGIPVLAECPPGDNADLVAKYSIGGEVITAPTRDALREAIRRAYDRRHTTQPAVHPEFAATFHRRALTGRLAAILDEMRGTTA
jgi:glycosyltransferase involved in cell wall biosynthesis